jgi:hypothetical protein
VFAYHRETGTPVWQSGLVHQESSANDVWILGAGPFQRGTIYDGTEFAGKALRHEEGKEGSEPRRLPKVELADESTFTTPQQLVKAPAPAPAATAPAATPTPPPAQPVVQASHEEPKPVAAAVAEATPIADQPKPPETAAKAEPVKPPADQSVYKQADSKTLPQPRFESR